MNLAVSGFVLSVATGCSGMGAMAEAPSRAAGKPEVAAKSADQARAALEAGKVSKAVGLAEAAVAGEPTRCELSRVAGAGVSQRRPFCFGNRRFDRSDGIGRDRQQYDHRADLGTDCARQERRGDFAVAGASRHRSGIDIGLALALAGDSEGAIYVLTDAARAPDASAGRGRIWRWPSPSQAAGRRRKSWLRRTCRPPSWKRG